MLKTYNVWSHLILWCYYVIQHKSKDFQGEDISKAVSAWQEFSLWQNLLQCFAFIILLSFTAYNNSYSESTDVFITSR